MPDAVSVYDAAGMRVAERVNDVWRFSVYDIGGKIVAEYGGVAATDEGGVKYLLSDWQGSNRAVLSNTGNVRARVDYTAYGENIGAGTGLRTNAQGFDSTFTPRQQYGLTERDDATGLDHTWFRKHENRSGRWTSPDPYNGSMSLGDPQSFNRYSYVNAQPTNFVDPSGLLMMDSSQNRGYCVRYHYYNPSTGEGFWGAWRCYGANGSTGGGSGGGSGTDGGSDQISEACKKAVQVTLGEAVLKKALELFNTASLIDIESAPSQFDVGLSSASVDDGSLYFGDLALPGESVGMTFDRQGTGAWAVRGKGFDGVYYRGSQTSFSNQANFQFHEVLHLVYPAILTSTNVNLDTQLVDDMGIDRDGNLTDSELVSRFFNSGCDPKYGGPIYVD